MKKSWWYRFFFLIGAVVFSVLMTAPTIFNLPEDSPFPVKSRINLGLDLQGGLYMVLGIDFNKVYRDEIRGHGRRIESFLNGEEEITARLGPLDASDPADPKQSILLEESESDGAIEAVRETFGPLLRLTARGEGRLEYALAHSAKAEIEEQSVTKSIEVIRNRIDEFGVLEPELAPQGKDRILLQLPGIRDIERAKALIGQTAKLEFRLVGDAIPQSGLQSLMAKAREAGITHKQGERFSGFVTAVNDFLGEDLPSGYRLAFERQRDSAGREAADPIPFLVEEAPRLTGEMLQDASVQIDPQKNLPFVSLEFTPQGGTIFEEVTGENVGRLLAVILDGNIYSAPVIRGRIPGGRAQIELGSGGYNRLMREARDLALVLRAGALPVELDFLEQRTVGPGLGRDSIEKARTAGAIGAFLVFLFILVYYRLSGLFAALTLSLNILLVLAALSAFGATLTLPGIAGIALTVGMAVDANIIIYERIREGLLRGYSNYKAFEEGFNRAFWTIIDANITTALAGFCLFQFGTGPIRGFAVALLIGIVSTVYTSYYVGRLLFEFSLNKTAGRRLSI